jgi:hypothetical protein
MHMASQNDKPHNTIMWYWCTWDTDDYFLDNSACVTQMESDYIKSNMTKYIIPKLFYPHELQKNGEIEILQTKSCDNLADLFIKSLPYSTFRKCVEGISMRRLRDLQESGGESF